ncbi:YjjG family noncanonical pyrimidine nucleotidase [Turneriella parva]|uniref:HAD superfamily (Subfamily IA) hydrolase, TIGR02254 n=1 Tax=Turneriella parva (strain ATCC BAA-1111 / DSM 21527 / NCTC 11395 / H) TaxID=869212 RepID=I4B335_TURPD|nr:YjjG family noncanonical pyrimidine nucleotidase [Turneriella parva]AFM11692.1 HAD superfamily (subfamily IA) hydrolase, TIGR02254 [Turneriella parva DSM 21527]
MEKYKIILFDADETLYDYKKNEATAFTLALRDKTELDPSKFAALYQAYVRINESLWKSYHNGEITKEKLLTDRFSILFHEFNLSGNSAEFGEYYLSLLGDQNFLMPDAEQVCARLSESCTLAIVTNGVSSVHKKRLNNSSINPYIAAIIVSGDFPEKKDFQKPNPVIFEYAHQLIDAGTPKEQILMIGDSLTSDVAGGIRYGIHTCWFNARQESNTTDFKPTYEINNLKELFPIAAEQT